MSPAVLVEHSTVVTGSVVEWHVTMAPEVDGKVPILTHCIIELFAGKIWHSLLRPYDDSCTKFYE